MNHWHIALIEPQAERIAAEALRGRGYEVYYPAFPKEVKLRRTMKRITMRAMFPGYMFVNDWRQTGWGKLEGLPGLRSRRKLLIVDGEYATLPNAAIEEIMLTEQRLCHQLVEAAKPIKYIIGQRVRLKEGPFAGHFANIETLDDAARIVLLMSLFGRESRVIASHEHLTPA